MSVYSYSLQPPGSGSELTVADAVPHAMVRCDASGAATAVGGSQDPAAAASAYLAWCAANTWVQWGSYPLYDFTCTDSATTSIVVPIPTGIGAVHGIIHGTAHRASADSVILYLRMRNSDGTIDTGASNYRYLSTAAASFVPVAVLPSSAQTAWTLNGYNVSQAGMAQFNVSGLLSTTVATVDIASQQLAYDTPNLSTYKTMVDGQWHPLAGGIAANYCTGLQFSLETGEPFHVGTRIAVFSC